MSKIITCENYRRFGVEIELNTTTNIIKPKHLVPDGSDVVAGIIRKTCKDEVFLNGWLHVNNNESWIIKPDSTCGIEINSPILKGGYDLAKLCRVVQGINEHPNLSADERCSFHVHVNMEDCSSRQIGAALAWWVKAEGVFFDAIPMQRKCHRHVQLIGMSDSFRPNYEYDHTQVIEKLSDVKYHSANCYHMVQNRRRSIEFRTAGHEYCLNPIFAKQWIRLLLHFVDRAINIGMPHNLNWLSTQEFFSMLLFTQSNLSPGMKQVKIWFLKQLRRHTMDGGYGLWSPGLRRTSMDQVRDLCAKEPDLDVNHSQDTLLYSKDFFL